jgi:hypothetical protein
VAAAATARGGRTGCHHHDARPRRPRPRVPPGRVTPGRAAFPGPRGLECRAARRQGPGVAARRRPLTREPEPEAGGRAAAGHRLVGSRAPAGGLLGALAARVGAAASTWLHRGTRSGSFKRGQDGPDRARPGQMFFGGLVHVQWHRDRAPRRCTHSLLPQLEPSGPRVLGCSSCQRWTQRTPPFTG